MSLLYIIVGVVALVVVWGIAAYNRFVRLVQQSNDAWSAIDVLLTLRYELIPNIVETVKGYASHERETLDAVISARAEATKVHIDPAAITPEAIAAMSGAEAGLSQALGKLLAVAEAYPDLKANTNFLDLQRELSDVENKIQSARRFYNRTVMDLLVALQSFPSNIIGSMFHFEKREYFEIENAAAKEPVKVSFK